MARILVALLLLQFSKAIHPRYALVDGDTETMWQRPDGTVKGIFFIAHGCKHQGPDVFTEVTETGEKFEECAKTGFGKCLGLPEEVTLRRYGLKRGYVVMSVSGGHGIQSCWFGEADIAKVEKAVAHIRKEEKLMDVPLLALGASSGGAMVGLLPGAESSSGLGHLSCIVPEVMGVDTELNANVPTLFIHMPKDKRTAAKVDENIQDLKSRKVRVHELRAEPQKVTVEYLSKCLDEKKAQELVKAYQEEKIIDSDGFITREPRSRHWTSTAKKVVGSEDTLTADESCLSELMNVAWAMHEFTSQFAQEIFDFCEGKEISSGALLQSADDTRWSTEVGLIEVFEFGETGKPLAVALHGMAKSKIHEWDHTAEALAKAGYHVLVPNFHSLPSNLNPGSIAQSQIRSIVHDLMKQSNSKEITLLLGKSWGGGVASELVSDPVLKVKKMVLVAPGGEMLPWPATCEVALFWCEDDPVVPIKKADQHPDLLQKLKLFHKEKKGGHTVLDSYIPHILQFAAGTKSVELLQMSSGTERTTLPPNYEPFKIFMVLLIGVALPAFLYYRRAMHEKRYEKRSPRGDIMGAKE